MLGPELNSNSQKYMPILARIAFNIVQKARVFCYLIISKRLYGGTIDRRQPVLLTGLGKVVVDGSIVIGYFPSPFFLQSVAYIEARKPDSCIKFGGGTLISNNFVAIAESSYISIGRNCLIGTAVELINSDFHDIGGRLFSSDDRCKPIIVGDDVFIGSNVKVLKGVTIGNGAVIANGSVVVRDIPANSVAAGNPCRVVRTINNG